MFDPTVGRWFEEDPVGLDAGTNLYEYVGNSPTNAADPSGLIYSLVVAVTAPKPSPPANPFAPGGPYGFGGSNRTGESGSPYPGEPPRYMPRPAHPLLVRQKAGVEVGPYLVAGLKALKEQFDKLSVDDKIAVINGMHSASGWDIYEFFMAGGGNVQGRNADPDGVYTNEFRGGGAQAGAADGTVTVFGKPYWAVEVNYVLWGFGRRLGYELQNSDGKDKALSMPLIHLTGTKNLVRAWRSQYLDRELSDPNPKYRRAGAGYTGRTDWAEAGWNWDGTKWGSQAEDTSLESQFEPNTTLYDGQLFLYLGKRTGPHIEVTITKADIKK